MAARHLLETADAEDDDASDMYADNGAVCRSIILGMLQIYILLILPRISSGL